MVKVVWVVSGRVFLSLLDEVEVEVVVEDGWAWMPRARAAGVWVRKAKGVTAADAAAVEVEFPASSAA